MVSKEELQRGLKTKTFGRKVFVFDTIDSTNACAKTLAEAGTEEGSVVFADYQTAGRGRMGRSWSGEPGANVLFSIILRPSLPKEKAGFLTFFSAVCVARAVERAIDQPLECKWPNDLILNGRKCCGILLENSIQQDMVECSIVGIGLNVNQENFEGLGERATSLRKEMGKEFDRRKIFQSVLVEMDSFYEEVRVGNFERTLKEWNTRCTMFGHPVSVTQSDRLISGIAVELSPDGGLVLETAKGRSTFYAGDVTMAH